MPTNTHKPKSKLKRSKALVAVVSLSVFSALTFGATGTASAAKIATGGATFAPTPKLLPGQKAKLAKDGTAIAPADAPESVKQAIWAANKIINKPYRYGGGHAKVEDSGYDCSGTVSYALIGGGLLDSPRPSSGFFDWGEAGTGQWVTIYTHSGHMYAVIAGLRLDTSGPGERGPRWRKQKRSPKGFKVRHPAGL